MGRRGCLLPKVRRVSQPRVVRRGRHGQQTGCRLRALTHANGSPPRYNIAPRSFAPVIRREQRKDTYTMHTMKFGLVPAWFKHEDPKLSTFNAQAEKLVETGGLWESMKKQKRCIVISQGFAFHIPLFILQDTETTGPATTNGRRKAPKTVFRTLSGIRMGSLCYSPGFMIVQTSKVTQHRTRRFNTKRASGSEKPLWSFSIVTTPASKDFEWLHDRQPVILISEDDIAKWLDPETDRWTKELSQLVQPTETHSTLWW